MCVVDWILFIIIFTVACKHAHKTRKRKGESNAVNTLRDSAVISITLATVLGLGWVFGLVATSLPVEDLTFVFQIIFSLFVGTQGALIFVFHGLRNADARTLWKKWFHFIIKKSHSKYTFTSSSKLKGLSGVDNTAQNSSSQFGRVSTM